MQGSASLQKGFEMEHLLHDWKGKINTIARYSYIEGLDQDDIEQELIILLWECVDKHNPDRGAFSTFFYTCAKNKLRQLFRKSKRDIKYVELKDTMGHYSHNFESRWFLEGIKTTPVLSECERKRLLSLIDGTKRFRESDKYIASKILQ